MKENKYDDESFFDQYSQMSRSVKGLKGAGEWYILEKMLPDFQNLKVLDLGCGYGWHCKYAVEHGAIHAVGIDISEKMIERAREINNSPKIEYHCIPIEDYNYPLNEFDIVISSLAFHYLESFSDIANKISRCLKTGGKFIFSVEHPVFTAYGNQDWIYGENGEKLHWPVNNYYIQGKRKAIFLGEEVTKYHRTLTTYISDLIESGFEIKELVEAEPEKKMLKMMPEMQDELRRPMILILSTVKK